MSQSVWPAPVINRELGVLWVLGFATLLASVFSQESMGLAVLIFLASINFFLSAYLIHSCNYRLFCATSVFSLTVAVFFPACVLANLLLPTPAVRSDLWPNATSALMGSAAGLTGFIGGQIFFRVIIGFFLASAHAQKPRQSGWGHDALPTRRFLILMCAGLTAPLVAKILLGAYYHISIQMYDPSSNVYLNFLSALSWICVSGAAGLVVRHCAQKKSVTPDLILVVVVLLGLFLAYMPSGSRMQAVEFLPLIAVVFFSFTRRLGTRIFFSVTSAVLIIFAISFLGFYRVASTGSDSKPSSILSRSIEALDNTFSSGKESSSALIVHRLSDFVATGRLIDWTPLRFNYRGFEGMEKWWQIAIPGIVRPEGEDGLDFNEGTHVTLKYRVSDGPWVSTPITIFGDLYSRFGWAGLIVGMAILGFALRLFDFILQILPPFQSLVAFVVYFRFFWQFYVASLLVVCTGILRELPLALLIGFLVSKLSMFRLNKGSSICNLNQS